MGTGRELPSRVVTNDDLTKLMDTSDEWIVQRTGIRERRYADPEVANCHLGTAAARKAIEKAGLSVGDIDR
jgi:3-oxoacyl-[acyl-carrier-protein] synthase-3